MLLSGLGQNRHIGFDRKRLIVYGHSVLAFDQSKGLFYAVIKLHSSAHPSHRSTLDHDLAERANTRGISRQKHGGGAVFLNDRRAGDLETSG